ncbi:NFX1-type zinc finger-containing protein 1-like protein [Leptotrombidium deliense]|uniref:NFX1-type zinc finger-containing protein 1-like protein n=1 Tax=Leptotrombidium deliense TaxID=299467 RepID=A0A443S7P6_9ACAR|nr:NFX1-type zinc finger-containing protein 1-like protein [Leptotrombidium deliense]
MDFFSVDHKDDEIVAKFYDRLFIILNFVATDFDNNSQQISDLNRELDLIFYVGKCMQLYFNSDVVYKKEFVKVFIDCFRKFCKPGIHTDDEIVELKEGFNKAFKIRTGIGIGIKEMNMIIETFDFRQKGHWYKCANNHVYCITECGGASQIGNCPECGQQIGGTLHRLLESNSIATELDGATKSAFDYSLEPN